MRSERPAIDMGPPAVVLKLDPNVMHHGGLGAIRTLGRAGVPVYGVHERPWAPAAHSRYLYGRCFWRPNPQDAGRVRDGLLRLAAHIGRPAVLFSTDDAGAIFLAEHGRDLRRWFLFPEPPPDLPRRLANKHSLFELCRELDVPCPRAAVPPSLAAARQFAASAGYPLIAKLTAPWVAPSRKFRSTSMVATREDLDRTYLACAQSGSALMLQEFIPGGPGHDWFFHGYCDATSACRPAFTGVKERSYPAHAGLTSLGRSVPNDRLRDQIVPLLARLGYRGILDLDLRLDARDGLYKLLDFNPRLGAQFRVFRDTAGIDVVLAAYFDLTGRPLPQAEQVNGRGFLVENYDPIGALDYWRRGELRLRPWISSLRTVDETAWFAADDLRPFGLMCVNMGWRLATRPFAGDRVHAPRAGFRYKAGRAASSPGPGAPGRRPAASAGDHTASRALKGGCPAVSDAIDVAIVGAGPYGLSLAAHLRAAGVAYRHFGFPMRLWKQSMPLGMFLKSQGFASNLSHPAGTHTLEAFCQAAGHRYVSYGAPVPLDTFVRYGEWFRSELGLDVEEVLVTSLDRHDAGFELTLADSERVLARRVVVAVGVEHFAHVPPPLSALPAPLCTHSSAHRDLSAFSGHGVIVVGAGQSALESAALLHENGACVQVVARARELAWNGEPLALDRPLLQRLREPEAGLGSGWNTWFYSNHPGLFRHLPRATRVHRARTALGPAGACWLRGRVDGQFPVLTGHAVSWAKSEDSGVRLGLSGPGGAVRELAADHVIAGTGYRSDLNRLPFLAGPLRTSLRALGGSPVVGRDYQSSVAGLYFIGPAVAPTFGPVMRFVYGSGHAATAVARQLTGILHGRSRATVATAR